MDAPIVYLRDVRRLLLEEHDRLRELLITVCDVARDVAAGTMAEVRLDEVVDELCVALLEHNQNEERYLRPLLAKVDAWGDLRVERMLAEHVAEHAEMRDALALERKDPVRFARWVTEFADRLTEHMVLEERTFLHHDVLRDDVISLGVSS